MSFFLYDLGRLKNVQEQVVQDLLELFHLWIVRQELARADLILL